jgi:Trypsin-like peptidase domain
MDNRSQDNPSHKDPAKGNVFRMTTKTVMAGLAFLVLLATAKFVRTQHEPPKPLNRDAKPRQTTNAQQNLSARSLRSRVGIQAFGCGLIPRTGAGVTVGSHLVLTDAHVVAGSTSIEVKIDGHSTKAMLVHLDPNLDLALLQVVDRHITWSEDQRVSFGTAAKGDQGWVTLLRNERLVPTPVEILRPVSITTEDIYVNGSVTRAGYEIKGSTRPGDSGTAVLVHGKIVGLLWSKSQLSNERAWLTDTSSIAGLIAGPQRWNIPKDTRCR